MYLVFLTNKSNEILHIDHLHPKSSFDNLKLKKHEFLASNKQMLGFYVNPEHWNAIPNLHLLNSSQNITKNDLSLVDWIADKNVNLTAKDLLIDGVDLSFESFQDFFDKRRQALKERLMSKVFMSANSSALSLPNDLDEQVID